MMLKQTKIVASISDQRCEVEFIRDLFKAGMNVVRMNTAHASREGFEKLITNVREVSTALLTLMGQQKVLKAYLSLLQAASLFLIRLVTK